MLSFIILILFGINFLFVISWAVHALEKIGTTDSPEVQLIDRVTKPAQAKILKVEVYNACGEQGVAAELADFLRKHDYIDVVYYGNYKMKNLPETRIIDRSNETLANAKVISKIVGVRVERLYAILSPDRQLDVTILIGKDYEELKAFKR